MVERSYTHKEYNGTEWIDYIPKKARKAEDVVEGSSLASALAGKVTSVKIGSTSYAPVYGVISLPSYPSTTNMVTGTSLTANRVIIGNGSSKIKASSFTIGKSVPEDAKFTDTLATVSVTGDGNAITSLSATNGAITATKGTTFLTEHQSLTNYYTKGEVDTRLNTCYTKEEVDNKITGLYRICGSTDTLPSEPVFGDVWNLSVSMDVPLLNGDAVTLPEGANIVWTEEGWDKLSETIDLSGYQPKLSDVNFKAKAGTDVATVGTPTVSCSTVDGVTTITFGKLKGATGKQGPTGPAGPQGPEGPQGLPGADGEPGAKGDKGDTGPQGPAGKDGAKGDTGLTGPQGPEGPQGPAGKDGVNGTSCTHSWNGTTLSITSASGTSSSNLKGEKGDKGDKGDTGPTGPQGPEGPAGSDGPQGVRGTVWRSGTEINHPVFTSNAYTQFTSADTLPGDMYLNTTSGIVYTCLGVTSTNSTWGSVATIKGADGKGISTISAPSTIDTGASKGNTYTVKLSGGTTAGTFTVYNGPAGPQGPEGPAGPQGPAGVNATTTEITSKSKAGLCPALPNETALTKYLRQDGSWQIPESLKSYYVNSISELPSTASEGDIGIVKSSVQYVQIAEDGNVYLPPAYYSVGAPGVYSGAQRLLSLSDCGVVINEWGSPWEFSMNAYWEISTLFNGHYSTLRDLADKSFIFELADIRHWTGAATSYGVKVTSVVVHFPGSLAWEYDSSNLLDQVVYSSYAPVLHHTGDNDGGGSPWMGFLRFQHPGWYNPTTSRIGIYWKTTPTGASTPVEDDYMRVIRIVALSRRY